MRFLLCLFVPPPCLVRLLIFRISRPGPALEAIFNNGYSIQGAPGNARFTYTAYDLAGGFSACDFFVSVRQFASTDFIAPNISSCPTSFTTIDDGPSSVFSDYNSSYATLSFSADSSGFASPIWPNITASDDLPSVKSFYYPLVRTISIQFSLSHLHDYHTTFFSRFFITQCAVVGCSYFPSYSLFVF